VYQAIRPQDGLRGVTFRDQPCSWLTRAEPIWRCKTVTWRAGFGEPFVIFFTRDEIDALLRNHGFEEMEHIGRDEARARYFGGHQDVEIAGAQALVSAMVRSSSAVGRTGS
jgi:O-methyltransferase involved in polyketide biosynthesis